MRIHFPNLFELTNILENLRRRSESLVADRQTLLIQSGVV